MRSDSLREPYATLLRFHGHRCPMSILGARLGRVASGLLSLPPGARLRARYEHRTCALDGIQVTTGCTLGNGNIEVVDKGRHRLLLAAEAGRPRALVELTPWALEQGRRYAGLREEARGYPEGSAERARIEQGMADVLAALEAAPDERVVSVLEVER